MADCLHQVTIACDDKTLYEAITTPEGIHNWWTDRCELANQEGGYSHFWLGQRPQQFTMRSQKLLPNRRIFLVCTHGPEEWVGTELWWEINPIDRHQCQLLFKHMNWHRDDGAFAEWNSSWGQSMMLLKQYCETKLSNPHSCFA